jgi:hypothetical protein
MNGGDVDWRLPAGGGPQFSRETFGSAYDEARAKALAGDDLALLQNYYAQRGSDFAGLANIVEFGLTLTHGSDWLSQGGKTLFMTDIVAPEVYAACERLKTKAVSNIKFSVLYNKHDIRLLPMCNLLYSVLSLRLTQATTLVQVLSLLLAKVGPGGLALIRAPTQHRLYQFMLPGGETANELNTIPQWQIFELLEYNGLSLVLVQEDPLLRAADVLYTTVLAQRTAIKGKADRAA